MNIKSKTMDISNNIDNDYSNIQLDDNNNKGNLYISLNISFFMNLCKFIIFNYIYIYR